MRKWFVIGLSGLLLLGVFLAGVYLYSAKEGKAAQEESPPETKETAKLDVKAYERAIRQRIEDVNKENYRIVSIDPNLSPLGGEMVQGYADVVTEKNGHYDWFRLLVLLEGENLLHMQRIPIAYYDRITSSLPKVEGAVAEVVDKAMRALPTDNRFYFGMDRQAASVGTKGIKRVEVKQLVPVGANEDRTEVVLKAEIEADLYERVRKGEYLLYLRCYENKKWQIEDIRPLEGTSA